MKLIIETGTVGDHDPEELELLPSQVLHISEGDNCISINNVDSDGNFESLAYHMSGEDWTELRLVNDEEI